MVVKYEKQGKIAIITINRPEALNAINVEANDELNARWREFRDDPNLWVAVLTGTGEKAFSAGADLKSLVPHAASLSAVERKERQDKGYSFGGITRYFTCWKPMIAAVNGFCIGGGLEMALACDIRLASENASFGLTEPRWGILPGGGGTQRLPRFVPLAVAMEMMLDAKIIDAQEALRVGLISKVLSQDKLFEEAIKLANSICEKGPLAVRAVKESVLRGLELPLEEGLHVEASLAQFLYSTEDAKEGPRAFAEKRKPNFKAK